MTCADDLLGVMIWGDSNGGIAVALVQKRRRTIFFLSSLFLVERMFEAESKKIRREIVDTNPYFLTERERETERDRESER